MKNQEILSKVPEVTLLFWVIKILATTLGETGGDAVSMSMNLYGFCPNMKRKVYLLLVLQLRRFPQVCLWTIRFN